MLRRNKFFMSLLLASIIASSMTGCKSGDSGKTSSDADKATEIGTSYPLKTDVTLEWWTGFSPISGLGDIKTFNDTEFAKQLIKETGVNIKWIHPPGNDAAAALNVLISSGDLPDIIQNDWYVYPGGPEAPINNGTTVKLNDLIDKYAPNLKAYLKANPDLDKEVKTDAGSYYAFPFLRDSEELTLYHGPIVRKDLLDKLGLEMPTTIDEYENVLKKFKESGVKAPLTFDWGAIGWDSAFVGAFNTKMGLFVEDGKVKFGQAEPGYKDFLALFKKWYDEGLLDKNFATLTGAQKDTAMTNGTSAMSLGLTGGNIGGWSSNAKKTGNGFKFAAAPYPVLKKGDTPKFGQLDSRYTTYCAAAITTNCKNPEIAAKVLDYGYSPEGIKLFNFGKEGESYTMKDGKPTYTDLILKNPDGVSIGSMLAKYTAVGGSPTIQQKDYIMQYLALPEQREALKTWKTDMAKYMLPRISLTPEESSDAASIINGINTYVNEMTFKFIMGTEPLSNFDKYVEEINNLGLQKYLKYQQDALERYNKR